MVSGLSGSGLVLRDNGGDDLAVSMSESFVFATKFANGAAYAVTVYTQPRNPAQTCVVTNGSGTMGSSNVTNVTVACTNSYSVGGMVSGLAGLGLVLNTGPFDYDALDIATNGPFTMPSPFASGEAYSVIVFTQPTNPAQTCVVTNGSGTMGNSNVTDVSVVCSAVVGFATATGSMSVARWVHAATKLLNGEVLITGGKDTSGIGLASAELYDPSTGLFTVTSGSMTTAHAGHTAVLLNNAALPNYGKVLIAGGDQSGTAAELYDRTAGTFAATGSMSVAHVGHTATLLNTGKVLLAGGNTAVAELYDPATETFSATGSMTAMRSGHTATLLLDGRVLITGGNDGSGLGLASAELYDPSTGFFTATTGSMAIARVWHSAVRMTNGAVLIVGTNDTNPERYDSGTETFAAVGDLSSFWIPAPSLAPTSTASLRADGTVLIAGGYSHVYFGKVVNGKCATQTTIGSSDMTASFAPGGAAFTAAERLNTARYGHTATVLSDGTVLVVGGVLKTMKTKGFCVWTGSTMLLSSAELFR
jgi:Galactose oxidase, central domain